MSTPSNPQTTINTDLTTEEGRQNAMRIIKAEEFNRFCDLQQQLVNQIKGDVLREEMETALGRMRLINAE